MDRVFRSGQWVMTSLVIPGAHTTPDGRSVGIHTKGKAADPATVTFVKQDGTDLVELVGEAAVSVVRPVSELPDLAPVLEADHLPEPRRRHLEPGSGLNP